MKTCVIQNLHYWQTCNFKFKVHTYEVIQSIKHVDFFFEITALCQEEDVEVVQESHSSSSRASYSTCER